MAKHKLLLVSLLFVSIAWGAVYAQTAAEADFDGSGRVDFTDFVLFARAFGSSQADCDLNGRGKVDFTDFVLFAGVFGLEVSPSGPRWTTYTIADGLAHDTVGAIVVGPDGGLWCAYPVPEGGISHYDGETWTHYTTKDGLASPYVMWGGAPCDYA